MFIEKANGRYGQNGTVIDITCGGALLKVEFDNGSVRLYYPEELALLASTGAAPVAQDNRYPHACPKCKGPAYIGFSSIDCSRPSCH